jgi:hypothetical protein
MLYEGNEPNTDHERLVFPNGWGDNDIKNMLVRRAFLAAMRQIPVP